MADNVEIQGLEFQIQENSAGAVTGLNNLKKALSGLKTVSVGSANNLSKTATGIRELTNALKGLNTGDASQKINRLATALAALGNLSSFRSTTNSIVKLNSALTQLKWTDGDKLASLATIVDSARNANAVVVGQVVGREQQKIDNLEWAYLTAEQWSSLLQEFKNFYVMVTYPDMVNNTWTTRKMYPGDRTAEPFHLDPETQLPIDYINCKVNLIDCGEPL